MHGEMLRLLRLLHTCTLCSVYHREKKEEALDKAKRQRVEVVLTTPDTVRTHVVCQGIAYTYTLPRAIHNTVLYTRICTCTCICVTVTYMYMYLGSSVGRALCLEYRVSWVRVPPEAAHFF